MYDDYDIDYTFTNDYEYNLDEYYAQDVDEDYARDGQDYQDLAYRHYAWYTSITSHKIPMPIAQKRLVRVTLDIECYDDLDLDNINWSDLLDLEGDENVYVSIKERGDVYWCDTSLTVTHVILWYNTIVISILWQDQWRCIVVHRDTPPLIWLFL